MAVPFRGDSEPLPVPGVAPDDSPLHTVRFNEAWLPYVVGALLPMLNESYWDGIDEEVSETVAQVDQLIAQFAAGYECP